MEWKQQSNACNEQPHNDQEILHAVALFKHISSYMIIAINNHTDDWNMVPKFPY